MRGIAFISGKFRGANHWEIHQNILTAERAIPQFLQMGYIPYCPHKLTENMQGLFPDEIYLEMCLEMIRRLNPQTDILFMLQGWESSEGSRQELELAKKLKLEILYEEG